MTSKLALLAIVIVFLSSSEVVDAKSAFSSIKSIAKTVDQDLQLHKQFMTKAVSSKATVAHLSDEVEKPTVSNPVVSAAVQNSSGLIGMTILFTLWYAFNAGFNVFNAYVKRDFAFPWTTAALQMLVGLFYAIPLWVLKIRQVPNLTLQDIYRLLPIACMNAFGHASTVIAMFEKGGGSFTHVIKASEPVVSVLLGFVVNGIIPKPFTGFSLLPVTYGVAYASTLGNLNVQAMSKELTTKAAKMAMASNFAFSMRSILRKNMDTEFKQRTKLDPVNEHAVTTLLSFLLLLPCVFFFEGGPNMTSNLSSLLSSSAFSTNLIICGMCFYLYNELQNVVLGSLGPVPTAVGNTLKRVVIFVALYFFTAGETFPWPKVLGCAIAIAGCFAFAVFDSLKV